MLTSKPPWGDLFVPKVEGEAVRVWQLPLKSAAGLLAVLNHETNVDRLNHRRPGAPDFSVLGCRGLGHQDGTVLECIA